MTEDQRIPIRKTQQENQVNPNLNIPSEVRAVLEKDAQTGSQTTTTASVTQRNQFPTEIIDLPSKGFFYPQDHPLANGQIELKFMTAKEEDILTSQNLIKKGIVLDKLLEALIVTPGVTLDDILLGDKNAIFFAARILAYGPTYESKITCPACRAENRVAIALDKINNKPFDFSNHTRGINRFEIDLPVSKKKLVYGLLTHRDEKLIEQELKALDKVNKSETSPEVTTRLKYIIKSVDGDESTAAVRNFIDNEFLSRDALAFRSHIRENSPDLDMTINFTCEECGHQEVVSIPMGIDFFWPDSRV